ncbi:MAG TPA: BREX system P-loop protein BrxC [Candidatus Saccharimonadales bacterium]|nr:BREX system P-loop protein BrxC [Candidatus Saccharimonadales bacterium]
MNVGELFSTNPNQLQLLNNGVAFVKDVVTPEELKTLRFELKTFVCEGEYAKGLEKILRTFLTNLDRPEQPAAWVSGFYGSGKSHMGKILRYLWNDFEFPEDKARARGLTNLSTEVADLLKELTSAGKRHRGLHAASGTLRGELGDNVRLSMLNIIFKSVGLPAKYPIARFVVWLRDNGKLDSVKGRVEKGGRDFAKELNNLWVSSVMHKALVDEELGASTSDIAKSLAQQFPNVKDITIDDMLQAIREALAVKGQMPCTLVVLDEVQQFIGDDSDRSLQIQEVVEACSKQLNSRMLIVATGQSALSGTPQLQKLRDRFRVAIQLSDTDVEAVIRKVITAKKPDKTIVIKKIISDYEGEVTRHLNGTKIEYRSEDETAYVPDYPLLPVRRRFWEKVLRAVDVAGTAAQLRNQLTVVYEAVRTYADRSVETVAGGDFMYWHKATDLLQTGILQPKIDEMIRKLDDGSANGKLSARICALVFLINKLPRETGTDIGIRAKADVLADLLVEDLKAGSAELRKQVPELLKSLEQAGHLMVVEEEYRIQTPESASWDAEFKKNFNRIVNDDGRIASERSDLLRAECAELKNLKVIHGNSKVARKVELFTGAETPIPTGQGVPVWVRDGWTVDEKSIVAEAQKSGTDSPLVFVYIPRRSADDLKKTVAGLKAAEETLNIKGTPTTPGGLEARAAIETRKSVAEIKLKGIVTEIVNGTRVFMAGGNEIAGIFMQDRVEEAAKNALTRLYPQFDVADDPRWEKVVERAKKGDSSALEALGFKGDPDKHPVCAAILGFVNAGKKGTEIRKHFSSGQFGWPQDAIDGALILLSVAGHLRVTQNGQQFDPRQLDHSKIGICDFRTEHVTISAAQKLAIRKLFQAAHVGCKPGEEAAVAPEFILKVIELAEAVGGEPPRPEKPDLATVKEIKALTGNEQLVKLYEQRDVLTQSMADWAKTAKLVQDRLPRWNSLNNLADHAAKLTEAGDARQQMQTIEDERQVLADPDPVAPLCDKLTQLLREKLTAHHSRYQQIYQDGMAALKVADAWSRLGDEQRQSLLVQHGLTAMPGIKVGTEDEVIASLEAMSLEMWQAQCDALPQRFQKGQRDAAKLIEPKVIYVTLPPTTIHNDAELEAWLAQVRKQIQEKLKNGPVGI